MAGGITKCKAAILENLGEPLTVGEITLPECLDAGQVLIKVYCSGICGTQLEEIDADRDPYLPHLLGHEGAGEVIDSNSRLFSIGDHVVLHWRKGRGIESEFPKYLWPKGGDKGTVVGGGRVTTFNEYAVISENRLTAVEDWVTYDVAALMGCSVTTGLGAVIKEARLQPGQSVAVIGCGGVGLNAIQGAAMISAYPVFAFDRLESKLFMAKSFGATHTGFSQQLRDAIGYERVDAVIECTGDAELMELALDLTNPKGKTIFVGLPHGAMKGFLKIKDIRKHFTGKEIIFSEGGGSDPNMDIPSYLRLYVQGMLKLDELITHRFKLDDINRAITQLRTGNCGRIIVEMP